MQDEQKIKSSQHGVSNPAAMKLEGKTTPMTSAALDPQQIQESKMNSAWKMECSLVGMDCMDRYSLRAYIFRHS
jgi:hypothetical protein